MMWPTTKMYNRVTNMALDYLGIPPEDRAEHFKVRTSVLWTKMDDSTDTFLVTILQFVPDIPGLSSHTMDIVLIHYVDDLYHIKDVHEMRLPHTMVWDGVFRFIDRENKESGFITFKDDDVEDRIVDEVYREGRA